MADFNDSTIARFWSKVDKNGPVPEHAPHLGSCWVWTAARVSKGYGSFRVAGRSAAAHRVVWLLVYGERPPDDLCVLHRCDNPACVRPNHLFTGTHKDNAEDRERKGRGNQSRGSANGAAIHPETRQGELNGRAKLTETQAIEIALRSRNGEGRLALAREFGVAPQAVWAIRTGRRWPHLEALRSLAAEIGGGDA